MYKIKKPAINVAYCVKIIAKLVQICQVICSFSITTLGGSDIAYTPGIKVKNI